MLPDMTTLSASISLVAARLGTKPIALRSIEGILSALRSDAEVIDDGNSRPAAAAPASRSLPPP